MQGAGVTLEQSGLEPMPIWDASTVCGNLACYATALIQTRTLLNLPVYVDGQLLLFQNLWESVFTASVNIGALHPCKMLQMAIIATPTPPTREFIITLFLRWNNWGCQGLRNLSLAKQKDWSNTQANSYLVWCFCTSHRSLYEKTKGQVCVCWREGKDENLVGSKVKSQLCTFWRDDNQGYLSSVLELVSP